MQLSFHIDELTLMASVGILPQERLHRQAFLINCKGGITPKRWPVEDLDDSVSYAAIADVLRDVTLSQHWDLLETLLYELQRALSQKFELLSWFEITLSKPDIIPDCKAVGLSLRWERSE